MVVSSDKKEGDEQSLNAGLLESDEETVELLKIKKAVRTPRLACSRDRGIGNDHFLDDFLHGSSPSAESKKLGATSERKLGATFSKSATSSMRKMSESDGKLLSKKSYLIDDVGYDHGSILSYDRGTGATYLGTDPTRHPLSDTGILGTKPVSRPGTSDSSHYYAGGIQKNTTKSLRPLVDRKRVLPNVKRNNLMGAAFGGASSVNTSSEALASPFASPGSSSKLRSAPSSDGPLSRLRSREGNKSNSKENLGGVRDVSAISEGQEGAIEGVLGSGSKDSGSKGSARGSKSQVEKGVSIGHFDELEEEFTFGGGSDIETAKKDGLPPPFVKSKLQSNKIRYKGSPPPNSNLNERDFPSYEGHHGKRFSMDSCGLVAHDDYAGLAETILMKKDGTTPSKKFLRVDTVEIQRIEDFQRVQMNGREPDQVLEDSKISNRGNKNRAVQDALQIFAIAQQPKGKESLQARSNPVFSPLESNFNRDLPTNVITVPRGGRSPSPQGDILPDLTNRKLKAIIWQDESCASSGLGEQLGSGATAPSGSATTPGGAAQTEPELQHNRSSVVSSGKKALLAAKSFEFDDDDGPRIRPSTTSGGRKTVRKSVRPNTTSGGDIEKVKRSSTGNMVDLGRLALSPMEDTPAISLAREDAPNARSRSPTRSLSPALGDPTKPPNRENMKVPNRDVVFTKLTKRKNDTSIEVFEKAEKAELTVLQQHEISTGGEAPKNGTGMNSDQIEFERRAKNMSERLIELEKSVKNVQKNASEFDPENKSKRSIITMKKASVAERKGGGDVYIDLDEHAKTIERLAHYVFHKRPPERELEKMNKKSVLCPLAYREKYLMGHSVDIQKRNVEAIREWRPNTRKAILKQRRIMDQIRRADNKTQSLRIRIADNTQYLREYELIMIKAELGELQKMQSAILKKIEKQKKWQQQLEDSQKKPVVDEFEDMLLKEAAASNPLTNSNSLSPLHKVRMWDEDSEDGRHGKKDTNPRKSMAVDGSRTASKEGAYGHGKGGDAARGHTRPPSPYEKAKEQNRQTRIEREQEDYDLFMKLNSESNKELTKQTKTLVEMKVQQTTAAERARILAESLNRKSELTSKGSVRMTSRGSVTTGSTRIPSRGSGRGSSRMSTRQGISQGGRRSTSPNQRNTESLYDNNNSFDQDTTLGELSLDPVTAAVSFHEDKVPFDDVDPVQPSMLSIPEESGSIITHDPSIITHDDPGHVNRRSIASRASHHRPSTGDNFEFSFSPPGSKEGNRIEDVLTTDTKGGLYVERGAPMAIAELKDTMANLKNGPKSLGYCPPRSSGSQGSGGRASISRGGRASITLSERLMADTAAGDGTVEGETAGDGTVNGEAAAAGGVDIPRSPGSGQRAGSKDTSIHKVHSLAQQHYHIADPETKEPLASGWLKLIVFAKLYKRMDQLRFVPERDITEKAKNILMKCVHTIRMRLFIKRRRRAIKIIWATLEAWKHWKFFWFCMHYSRNAIKIQKWWRQKMKTLKRVFLKTRHAWNKMERRMCIEQIKEWDAKEKAAAKRRKEEAAKEIPGKAKKPESLPIQQGGITMKNVLKT